MEETKKILELLQEILRGYTDEIVTEEAGLEEELGLDSFLTVYFLTEVEDAFEIDIDESEFKYIHTVQDILDRIREIKKFHSDF